MTRTASWFGWGLGSLLFLHALQSVGGGSPFGLAEGAGFVLGFGIFLCAVLTIRGWRPAQLVLVGLSLVVLGWELPVYFGSYRPWPGLVFVALASGTFGFGMIGFLIDRYPARGERGDRL